MPDVFVAPEEQQQNDRLNRQGASISEELPPVPIQDPEKHEPMIDIPTEQASNTPQVKSRIPLFTSFWKNPQGVYFEDQEVDEHIILFLRKHFITNIPWILATLALLLLPLLGVFLVSLGYQITIVPPDYVTAITVLYYLFVITHAFTHFINWYYNITLITPRRIVDIEVTDLMYKKISETKMTLVQDITIEQSGAFRSFFDYGNVLIQTAGTQDNFHIESCPKPELVEHTVNDLIGFEIEAEGRHGLK